MAQYKSNTAHIEHDINLVYSKLSTPSCIGNAAEALPEEQRKILEQIQFTENSIVVKGSPIGDMTLLRTQAVEPSKIVFEAQNSPMPFKIVFNLAASGNATDAVATLDIDIPIFLRPMVNGPLEKAAGQFAELLKGIPYDKL